MKNKLIIVAGCSGSGKTTVSKAVLKAFKKGDAQIICIDRFYKKSQKYMPKTDKSGNANFDHPDAIDWPLLRSCLTLLLNGKSAKLPCYDYIKHVRMSKTLTVKPTRIIILEGVLGLYDKQINKMAELKIFVDTHSDECFARRLKRDQQERGRSLESIVLQWIESVKPMYDKYVKPSRWSADLLLPWDTNNQKSLKYLAVAIENILI